MRDVLNCRERVVNNSGVDALCLDCTEEKIESVRVVRMFLDGSEEEADNGEDERK